MTSQIPQQKDSIIITKRIAKHGKQSIIVIPKILEDKLKPGMIAKISIDVIEENKIADGLEEGK